MTLLQQTIFLLDADRGDWSNTAKETGLGYEWIKKVANNKVPDPGVNKIETLHGYLSIKHKGVAA